MAKVATRGTLPSNSHQIGGGSLKMGSTVKRKTPSELRGEQLKRVNVIELVDESPAPLLGSTSNTSEVGNGLKKPDLLRNPRYIDTRMDEVYPAKKSRFRILSKKENDKDNSLTEQPSSLKNLSTLSNIAAKRRDQLSCSVPSGGSNDGEVQARQTIEKCSQSMFRSVTELSLGGERLSNLATVDMDKALKGLVAHEPISDFPDDSSGRFAGRLPYSGDFRSECHILGRKAPLDFTLKTYMRVVSSSSVHLIHRSMMCGVYNGLPQFTSHSVGSEDRSSMGITLSSQILSSKALHSWVYPQSSLPPSLISVLTSSAKEGVEMDFLRKRQLAWEDSFRSLYYMFRKNACSIFYVCTSHFVVMFIGSDGFGIKKHLCNAYISQSTRGLRSLLKEHDVSFTMPLCKSKVEQVTTEDLVELSEIEKHNLGQARRSSSLPDIDNTPQSLLAFNDNKNVHALYDFLLNYRSFLTLLTAVDVPVLYSPEPFQNAALSAPEISCTEIKRSDSIAAKRSVTKDDEALQRSPGFCCSIEIKDTYLPPWIICNIFSLMSSEGKNFEASFTTERTSVGLNVALVAACEKSDAETTEGESLPPTDPVFGISEAIVSPYLRSGYLKSLEHSGGSYTASLSPV
ncbi:protein downstream neighbor of son homolog [Pistacia vera]|uniref:protein downstream neighbor of son homolog n=1 Tax=Pistacia vera TaxID=55513 RepID=UPI001263D2B3|nr:protein downstream neighbor of son homolog [Pistacia vera]